MGAYDAFTVNNEPLGAAKDGLSFKALTIVGDGQVQPVQLLYKDEMYDGKSLLELISSLSTQGKLEPSGVSAISSVLSTTDNVALSGKWFVLLGAGSEMGPCEFLLQRGATVVAIRTRKAEAWKGLALKAKQWPGTLVIPTEDGSIETAGVDVIKEPNRVHRWLCEVVPAGVDLTVGFYIYLDGVRHVMATVACDFIMTHFQRTHDARLAYIGSPSISVPVTSKMVESANENRASAPWYIRLAGSTSVPTIDFCDSSDMIVRHDYSTRQGPNYALAKTLQNMRAVLSEKLSYQMGPATRTESVVHNKTMEKVLNALEFMPPCETFEPSFVAPMCGLLLLSDVFSKEEKKNHPMEPMLTGNFHGGLLRCGYAMDKGSMLNVTLYSLGAYIG